MDVNNLDLLGLNCALLREFPQNTKPLENQVAGHSFEDGTSSTGMLKDEEGYVLKPVNKQGKQEILFYETIQKSVKKEIVELRKFVPEYFGITTLPVNGKCMQFLKLADATRGYKRPCVMDIKIGRQTWEPGAPLEKQKKEEAKYILCKRECGFCIPGFQVHTLSNGCVEKFGKEYGKKLTKDDIPAVLKKFLNQDSGNSRKIGEEILRQLNEILLWWRYQRDYHIYSSSVLLTYDAELLRIPAVHSTQLQTLVHVVLIDFAHVHPANNALDLNYLTGLQSLVDILTHVVNEL